MRKGIIALATGALLGGIGLAAPAIHQAIAPQLAAVQSNKRRATRNGGSFFGYPWGYRTGPGWTDAHVRRMAKKRRNQQRHRKACRKGGNDGQR